MYHVVHDTHPMGGRRTSTNSYAAIQRWRNSSSSCFSVIEDNDDKAMAPIVGYIHNGSVDPSFHPWRRAKVNEKTWWVGSPPHTTADRTSLCFKAYLHQFRVEDDASYPTCKLVHKECTYSSSDQVSLTNGRACGHFFNNSSPRTL